MKSFFDNAHYPLLGTFDSKTQNEILLRAKKVYEAILEMEKDPLFLSLTAKTSIGQVIQFFFPQDRNIPINLLRFLTTYSDDPDNIIETEEDKKLVIKSRDWFAEIVRLIGLDLSTELFTHEEIVQHHLVDMLDKELITITDEDTGNVFGNENFRSDGIIWGIACAQAESLYGIKFGGANFLPLFTFLKRDLDTDEHREKHKPLLDLMERLESFHKLRSAIDKDESFVEIETLKSITKLNEKTIVNASKSSKETELVPVDENGNTYKNTNRKRIPRKLFQTKSAKDWILSKDRKKSKEIIFKDSLYYTEEQKKESPMLFKGYNLLVNIPAENKEELEQFLTENQVD